MDKLEQYLDRVCRSIGGPKSLRQSVRLELREHLRDAIAEHRTAGLSETEALARALEEFGGPEEVRAELEATHGHRKLMAVVIDKAMQWKETTMKSKWLWSSWAHLAVLCIVALDILMLTFGCVVILPKIQKIKSDGWLDVPSDASWAFTFLRGLGRLGENAIWFVLLVPVAWGLFEWRVRSENKPFIRLALLGTIAVKLTIVAMIASIIMQALPLLGMPRLARLARPFALGQIAIVNTTVAELEKGPANMEDWSAAQENADKISNALQKLTEAIPSLARREQPTLDDLLAQLQLTNEAMREVHKAIGNKDAARLKTALSQLHKAFEPIMSASKMPEH